MTENQNTWAPENLKKIIASVYHYSATDKEFRKLCLAEPKKAVEKIAGEIIPEGINIKFLESDPNADITYLLPDLVSEDELSDNELAHVSGGRSNSITTPLKNLSYELYRLNYDEQIDGGIVCAGVGTVSSVLGVGRPTLTGMAADAVSKAVDSNYGQSPV